jgi:hypothetical protein
MKKNRQLNKESQSIAKKFPPNAQTIALNVEQKTT